MSGDVSINQPSDLGISLFDRIATGTFFKFINPTGVQPTGLCVKISKEELFDFKRRIKHDADDMKLMVVQIMTVDMTVRPDYGPSLKTSYNDKLIRKYSDEDCSK